MTKNIFGDILLDRFFFVWTTFYLIKLNGGSDLCCTTRFNLHLTTTNSSTFFAAHLQKCNNQNYFDVCLCLAVSLFFLFWPPVNGYHSVGSPLHHVEHSHNSLVRKSSTEQQVMLSCISFLFLLLVELKKNFELA